MEIGKWIVFAFLLGAVLVGFKSRQLKAYEFIICGTFMILLDGLIFHGAISRWIGEIGSNAKNAVSLGDLPGWAALGAVVPVSTPRVRRLATACWLHRPGMTDVIVVAVCSAVLAGVTDLPVLVTGAVFTGTLLALTVAAAVTDPEYRAMARAGKNLAATAGSDAVSPNTGGRADG